MSTGAAMNRAKRSCSSLSWLAAFALVCAGAQAEVGPEIYLSPVGIADGTIGQGEPLQVRVLIEAPDEAPGPWLLTPASGTWADAVAVEIVGVTRVRATVVGQPEQASATIDADNLAGGLWRFSAESMQNLLPGDFALRATLAVSNGPGWQGEVQSDDHPITVLPGADPARAGLTALAFARDALLTGQIETAAKVLDGQLERDPLQFRLLLLRATAAEQAGNLLAADWLLNLAQLGSEDESGGYPNTDLYETRQRIQAARLEPAHEGQPLEPPSWSWPSPAVLRALAEREEPVLEAAENSSPAPLQEEAPVESAVVPIAERAPAENDAPGQPGENAASMPAIARVGAGPVSWLGDALVSTEGTAQWAVSARAGSEYGPVQNSASRATGAPDVPGADDHPNAWCPAVRDSGTDWLELTFERPGPATEVRVRQSYGPGSIVKVEAIDTDGQSHVWWEGLDPYGQEGLASDAVWFSVRVPATGYAVQKIRLTLDLGLHGRWKQIDAVQLIRE